MPNARAFTHGGTESWMAVLMVERMATQLIPANTRQSATVGVCGTKAMTPWEPAASRLNPARSWLVEKRRRSGPRKTTPTSAPRPTQPMSAPKASEPSLRSWMASVGRSEKITPANHE